MRATERLTGQPAFEKFIEIAFPNGGEIWLKASHNSFFVGEANPSGRFPIYATQGSGTERRRTAKIEDAYTYLASLSRAKDGGVFFIPGKPEGYPLKDYCRQSDLISAEMDSGTAKEQWERIRNFTKASGLIPALIIGSGGRSLHIHFKLDQPVDIAIRTELCKQFAILLQGDPAVCRPHQPMRVPGFFRREKGNEQTLEPWSD